MSTTRTLANEHEARSSVRGEIRTIKGADGKAVKLGGHAILYDVRSEPLGPSWSRFYEVIRRGCFARALRGEDDVRFYPFHDSGLICGRTKSGTLRLNEDSRGITFECDSPDTQAAKDLVVQVERGDVTGVSFEFRKIKDQWREEREGGVLVEVREVLEAELFAINPEVFPAYKDADVALRSLKQARDERATPILDLRRRELQLREHEFGLT